MWHFQLIVEVGIETMERPAINPDPNPLDHTMVNDYVVILIT